MPVLEDMLATSHQEIVNITSGNGIGPAFRDELVSSWKTDASHPCQSTMREDECKIIHVKASSEGTE